MFNLTINFQKLRDDLIPMYKVELDSMLKVFSSPVKTLYNEFIRFRKDTHYTLGHNGQVIYLRKVLNDRFLTNEITIVDGLHLTKTYVYRKIEGKDLVLYRKVENEAETVLYNKAEFEVATDFIVRVPLALNLSNAQIIELKGLVRKYALPNKTFKIELI